MPTYISTISSHKYNDTHISIILQQNGSITEQYIIPKEEARKFAIQIGMLTEPAQVASTLNISRAPIYLQAQENNAQIDNLINQSLKGKPNNETV